MIGTKARPDALRNKNLTYLRFFDNGTSIFIPDNFVQLSQPSMKIGGHFNDKILEPHFQYFPCNNPALDQKRGRGIVQLDIEHLFVGIGGKG